MNCYIYQLACRSLLTGKSKSNPYNAIFYEYYHKKISEGKTKHQAIICIMRRIINILYNMLRNDSEYVHPSELDIKCKNIFLLKKEEMELKEKLKQKIEKHNIFSYCLFNMKN